MLIHVPRVALAIIRGRAQRAHAPPGVGLTTPHVYAARAGPFFDIDSFGHMNNASYLVHCELARWELTAASGLLEYSMRERCAFIVGMTAVSYKREIKPLQRFEIHSQLVDHDEKWMTIAHEFRSPVSGDLLAMTLCRAVMKQRGGTLSPRVVLDAIGVELPPAGSQRPEIAEALGFATKLDGSLRHAMRVAAPADRL
jgi:YbgC/YbaW family acyl-CoA thioester hydrolase